VKFILLEAVQFMKKQIMALATIFTLGTGAFTTNAFAAEHTIKKGETLSEISEQYSMTVEDVKSLNDLSSDRIIANEILSVLDDSDFYTIQQGDTLFEIGQAKDATVNQLMKWNNLSTEIIFAGDILAVTLEAGKHLMKEQATQQTEPETNTETKSEAKPETKINTQDQEKSTIPQQESKPEPTQEVKTAENEVKTLTMTATAYTAYCEGCSGITANGTDLRANPSLKVIAVDPSIIPLGTKVWVEGYGEAIAADTGGAIKGNIIDLFIPSESDAINWGRKTVQVKILN
jgi:N-acetylmuramoyl-L-alanine amidase